MLEPEPDDPLAVVDDWAMHPTDKVLKMISDTEASYPESWKHPARSDISKYTKQDVYWNGDL